jgi:hypothetical protein
MHEADINQTVANACELGRLVLENWWNGMWNMVFPIIPFIP